MIFDVLMICVLAASAQTAASAEGDAQALSRAWGAIAAGRPGEAVALADEVLKRRPRSHPALTVKIEALVAGARPLVALDTYEQWLAGPGSSHEDRGLLAPIAGGILRGFSTEADLRVRSTALKALAGLGDEAALQALRKDTATGEPAAMTALASLGDAGAIAALQQFVAGRDSRDKSAALTALAGLGALSPAVIDAMLKHPVPMNRAAAARAIGATGAADSVPRLQALRKDADPFVRLSAMLALSTLGDDEALAEARALLASDVPDLRLRAAESLGAALPREAEQAVRPLLQDPDGLNRYRAAAVISRSDPDAARAVFLEGMQDRNPVIQQEAARLFTTTLPADLSVLRKLLRHGDSAIVVSAAAAIVRGEAG